MHTERNTYTHIHVYENKRAKNEWKKKKKNKREEKVGEKNWSRNRGRKTHCALPVLPRRCPLFSMFPCNWKLVRGNVTCSRVILHVRFVSSLEHACSVSCSCPETCKKKKVKDGRDKRETRRDETKDKIRFSLFLSFNPVYIYMYICVCVHIYKIYIDTHIYTYIEIRFFNIKLHFFPFSISSFAWTLSVDGDQIPRVLSVSTHA